MNLQELPSNSGTSSNKKGFFMIIKNILLSIWNGIVCVFKWIFGLLKKIWKWLLGLAILAAMIIGGIEAYDYYHYTYIPEKLLEEASNDVITKYQTLENDAKFDLACDILRKEQEWGYEGVSDEKLSVKISHLREDAFKCIENLAFAGDPKAQYGLGQLYYWGEEKFYYVKEDEDKAAYWWSEAANQEYTKAYNNVGIAYKKGIGVKVDMNKAIKYLKMGAEAGEASAQRNYGDLFLDGVKVKIGSHKEEYTTMEYQSPNNYKRSYWTQDNRKVYVIERVVDDYKTLIAKDIETAKLWWKKAAAQGNEEAKSRLQKVYE